MDQETAFKIAAEVYRACAAPCLEEVHRALPDVSLAQMLEANAIARKAGKCSVADRGIAAHYAFQKFGSNVEDLLYVLGFTLNAEEEE